mmetsp:Transcript_34999/g.53728  ORF Transcript_34999/g.53728 Transcript_34999/m.53728 type:complete len:194 (+) Transcript_34999:123-704(+)
MDEHFQRFQVFKENLRHVKDHNSEGHGFEMGVTMFSDLTEQEFIDNFGNPLMEEMEEHRRPMVQSSRHHKNPVENVRLEPDMTYGEDSGMDIADYGYIDAMYHCPEMNWVEQGKVLNNVKDQGKCGSCWAHSTVAAVENLYARYFDLFEQSEIPSLSEQQLVDCNLFPNAGCIGGRAIWAFNYTKNFGLTTTD